MKDEEIIRRYGVVLEYCSTVIGCNLYPQELLPVSKSKLKELLSIIAVSNPAQKGLIEASISNLNNFIPFKDALRAAICWEECIKKKNALKHDPEMVKEYFEIFKNIQ